MDFRPNRTLGTLIGSGLALLLMGGIGLGVSSLDVTPVTPSILLWVALPLVALPLLALVIYRLYGLWTAVYRIDRDGLYLRWGLARQAVPLADVSAMVPAGEYDGLPQPRLGFWWPGCLVTEGNSAGDRPFEFFAGSDIAGGIVVTIPDRDLLITPPDPVAFKRAFVDATRLGSLDRIRPVSERPDFLLSRVWSDQWARGLIVAGLLIPLALLGYLGWRAPALPVSVPFGFDATGVPNLMAPPGRLLLLPMLGGALWLVDTAAGAWLFRRDSLRPLAYALWAGGILATGLLWGATLQLITAV